MKCLAGAAMTEDAMRLNGWTYTINLSGPHMRVLKTTSLDELATLPNELKVERTICSY